MKVTSNAQKLAFQYAMPENPLQMSHSKVAYIQRNSARKAVQPTMECKSQQVLSKRKMHTIQCAKV
jgi:hypothetical protein